MDVASIDVDDDDDVIGLNDFFAGIVAIDAPEKNGQDNDSWRNKERKMKTLNLGIVLCFNLGVDPPDVVRTNPCSNLLCWFDPSNFEPTKATEMVAARLLEQYRRWQPKIKCKQALDPTFDEVRRMCSSLRRRAKDEPVLFHFNGLGVPRPTPNGELWVFNRNYTQYLPFSVYDLQTWINGPAVFVYDCSGAGTVVHNFLLFAEQRNRDIAKRGGAVGSVPAVNFIEQCIQLAACGPDETLPSIPELPADLFTSCLTTPIKSSLQWAYASGRKHLLIKLDPEMIKHTPGTLNDRRTMLGQLNWIFTAITDTIAWNVLPRDLFHKLFRNDLLVAALFRNFLLAARIMRSFGCTPVSHPALPDTSDYPLWQAWDMASDMCLAQLPGILAGETTFQSVPFFSDQLTAFEVWLSLQADGGSQDPPEQLPIVLQVLLSQQHRLRALELLEQFLSLGPWAVRKALSVGIFPYVFKLLGSPAADLRPVLISLWAKILAEDPKCKVDLLKSAASPVRNPRNTAPAKAFTYFVTAVNDPHSAPRLKALAAFVISVFADDHAKGQDACVYSGFLERSIPQLQEDHSEFRICLCLALGSIWRGHVLGRRAAIEAGAIGALTELLVDPVPKVRAAAIHALGLLIPHGLDDSGSDRSSQYIMGPNELSDELRRTYICEIGLHMLTCVDDGSHAVRSELAVAISAIVSLFSDDFSSVARMTSKTTKDKTTSSPPQQQQGPEFAEIRKILRLITNLASDPVSLVSTPATEALRSIGLKHTLSTRAAMRTTSASSIASVQTFAKPTAVPADKHRTWERPMNLESPTNVPNSYVWQTPRKGQDKELNLQLIEEITDAIGGVIAQSVHTGSPARDSLVLLSRQIADVAGSSTAVYAELQKAKWKPQDFLHADIEQLNDLRSHLKDSIGKSATSIVSEIDSRFMDWYCGTLQSRSLMEESPPVVNLTSDECDIRDWRLEQYEAVKGAALDNVKLEKSRPGSANLKLSDTIFHTPTREVADKIVFHPTEPVIILANKTTGNLYTWKYEELQESCSWNNNNRADSYISSIRLVNEHNQPLLAVGSSDGMVKLWSNYCGHDPKPTLVTGWRAVSRIKETQGMRAGLVLDWNQREGRMFASGDVEFIQIWDAATESRFLKIPTRVSSCVTSMCVNNEDSGLLSAGFGNGNVCLFDPRVSPDQALVQKYEQHQSWIVNVNLQRVSENHVISGSRRGDILWWDPRFPGQAVRKLIAFSLRKGDRMTAMEVHDYASVLATATPLQFIKIFNLDGQLLNHQKYYTNFMGEPIGANSCLAFHPFLPRLATGSHEKIVTIYAPTR